MVLLQVGFISVIESTVLLKSAKLDFLICFPMDYRDFSVKSFYHR